MAERRSLGAAIMTPAMTPEAKAFINSGKLEPRGPVEKVKDIQTSTDPADEAKLTEKRSRSRTRSAREENGPEATEVLDELLVSRTARFQYRTAQALTRAHLERKLKRLRPTTQQEIIEIAVQAWLRDHCYLD